MTSDDLKQPLNGDDSACSTFRFISATVACGFLHPVCGCWAFTVTVTDQKEERRDGQILSQVFAWNRKEAAVARFQRVCRFDEVLKFCCGFVKVLGRR
ncbi:hypothetical protein L1987_78310 [Smallanthus sonchifolius]|uniref:Uncharacterized protein n=1 Tax=Smallanthus sonchifolius TaxID=185202 RepID=A0ACB8ZCB5_9ASTR|nr:hypothetical protein L1987_78310 [Smallanthus sonchifolius]